MVEIESGVKTEEVAFELRVDDEVYRSIASRCLDRVPAVLTLGRIAKLPRPVRSGVSGPEVRVLATNGGPVQVDLTVDLDDTAPIPAVATSLQKEVKTVIEDMTGVEVNRIDVTVRRLWTTSEFAAPPPIPSGKRSGESETEE